jgi:sarcosine oxidase subunit gamma
VWLGPRSWLLLATGMRPSPWPAYATSRDAINAAGGALFDVGASRVAFSVHGPLATTVLAKSCPLDFHPRAFATGQCAQSLLGQVNALFCKIDDTPAFTVMVARSLADDAWRTLCLSAAQYGYVVG